MMSERTVGVGIVGFGWMGKTHAFAYQSIPFYYRQVPVRTRMVGVAVRRPETIDEAIGLCGFEFGTTRYEDLLRRDDIGIINVCTPNDLHAEQVIAAIEAGKHVYCDKPLATSYAECRRIADAAKRAAGKVVTQVALQYRYYPCTMRARQIVEEGRLGRIQSFRACYLHASLIDPNRPAGWRSRGGKGGGSLADMGSHLLDMLTHLVGPIEQVLADCRTFVTERKDPVTGRPVPVEADDLAVMLLRTRDGAIGTAEASKVATGVNDELRVEIHGDKGAMRFNLADPNWLEFYDQTDPEDPCGGQRGFKRIETIGRYPAPAGNMLVPKLNIGWINAHIASLHHFLAAVAGQAKPQPDFIEGAELQRLLDTAYASAKSGKWESAAECSSESR